MKENTKIFTLPVVSLCLLLLWSLISYLDPNGFIGFVPGMSFFIFFLVPIAPVIYVVFYLYTMIRILVTKGPNRKSQLISCVCRFIICLILLVVLYFVQYDQYWGYFYR